MRASLKLCLLVCAMTLLAAWSAPAAEGVRHNGALRVDGTQLVNSRGEAIQLRGMSSHGLHWFPEYTCYSAILETKKRGANLFRLAMYADSVHGGYSESPEAADLNKRLLLQGLENALAADMYVIVDWHLLEDEDPLRLLDQALSFFREITSRYPDHPAILYEICNEPNGVATWESIHQYAGLVIPAIREMSPNAVILVGTPDHSTDVLAAVAKPLSMPNIMYAYHFYTGFSERDFRHKLDAMRSAGLPVFVSEWGLSRDEDTGVLDEEEARAFLGYMSENAVSWANWSLSNKDEEFSAIKPGVTALRDWTTDDLTVSGKLVFNALAGE